MRVLVIAVVLATAGLGFVAGGPVGAVAFAAGMSVYAWLKGGWS